MRTSLCLLLLIAGGCREKAVPPPAAAKPVIAAASAPAARAAPMPSLPTSAFAWSFAEASDSHDAWVAVAETAATDAANCTADCNEVVYELAMARNHVVRTSPHQPPEMEEPAEPLPPEVEASVAAIDAYVALLPATDDQVAGLKFLAGAALWRWREPGAVARLEEVLRDHRDDETAEYAANQLLDMLMREERIPELREWVAELSADETFLANKPDLRETLEGLTKLLATLPA